MMSTMTIIEMAWCVIEVFSIFETIALLFYLRLLKRLEKKDETLQ